MSITIPKGVFDILPEDPDPKGAWRHSHIWQYLEAVIRETVDNYGYREIRTPIFENTELFCRGVGEGTDIVSKEMYTFEDKGNRSLTLRPEFTAAVMRSFIEKKLYTLAPVNKLYYIGPCFRYERPQAGRFRQHHQIGIEAIGYHGPEQDVEVIDFAHTLYSRLGLKNLTIYINSVGDLESRSTYRDSLKSYLSTHLQDLSEDSQRRFLINPLRILDSKDPKDQEILQNAPSILEHLNTECAQHFEHVCSLLNSIGITYIINPKLVRGLDYYTKTVFEVTSGDLGAQNSVGGGGRYDDLIHNLGGPNTPSVGFASGIERIIQALLQQNAVIPSKKQPQLFLIPLGDHAQSFCFSLLHEMRQLKVRVEMSFDQKKLKQAMRYADILASEYVIVVGDTELETRQFPCKRMSDGTTEIITLENLKKKFG